MSNGSNKTEEQALTQEEREERKEQIRLAAYHRWEAKGKSHGGDKEDWYEAEDSLEGEIED